MCFLWVILQLRKGISVTILHKKIFSVSVDVTFHEQESYFTIPYRQGENSVMEDKDRGDFLFLDLPSLPLSKQSRPTDSLIETLPKLPDQPELVLPNQLPD